MAIWAALAFGAACGPGRPPASVERPGVPAVVGRAYEHTLVIHCGVRFTVFDGRDWVADPPIDDGSGNPPPGWTGAGTMVLLRPDRARFTSVDGDVAEFRPRAPGEPPFFCA